jgi:hypothetical protein
MLHKRDGNGDSRRQVSAINPSIAHASAVGGILSMPPPHGHVRWSAAGQMTNRRAATGLSCTGLSEEIYPTARSSSLVHGYFSVVLRTQLDSRFARENPRDVELL